MAGGKTVLSKCVHRGVRPPTAVSTIPPLSRMAAPQLTIRTPRRSTDDPSRPRAHRRKSAVPWQRFGLGNFPPHIRRSRRPPAGNWGSQESRLTCASWLSVLWACRPPVSRRSWAPGWQGEEQREWDGGNPCPAPEPAPDSPFFNVSI